MANPNTVATPIVDKNGKPTTVHKNPDKGAPKGSSRVSNVPAPQAPEVELSPEEQKEQFAADKLYGLSEVWRVRFDNYRKAVAALPEPGSGIADMHDVSHLAETGARASVAAHYTKVIDRIRDTAKTEAEVLDRLVEVLTKDLYREAYVKTLDPVHGHMYGLVHEARVGLHAYLTGENTYPT